MKYLINILRILVGLLFIFSGLIKSNDPTGFSYKLDEYFTVFADDLAAKQDSITVSLTSVDGTTEQKVAISADQAQMQLVGEQSDWIPIPVDDETTLLLSTAKIKFGGYEIASLELNASDSGELAHEMEVILAVNGNELHNEQLRYKGNVTDPFVRQIDVSTYQKQNSWLVGFFNGLRDYALVFSIVICVIEMVLGLALLIGWASGFTVWMLMLMVVFFGFLTWYSAEFDKVTDCGCFGDAIKLTPWQSFNKDLILFFAILILLLWKRHIRPLFSNPFSVRFLTICSLLATAFSIYCWHYLPVKNFLKFKEGVDIRESMKVPEGGRETDHLIREYIYDNHGEQVTVIWDSDENSFTPAIDKAWTFVEVGNEKVLEKRDDPPIHDFKIMDESQSADYVDDFFNGNRFKLMIVMNDLEQTNIKAIPKLKELIAAWKEAGHAVYPLTASQVDYAEAFRHEYQLDVPFYYGDKTNLKSIIRSNPGLVLVDSTVVVKTWPSTRLPSVKKLIKCTE